MCGDPPGFRRHVVGEVRQGPPSLVCADVPSWTWVGVCVVCTMRCGTTDLYTLPLNGWTGSSRSGESGVRDRTRYGRRMSVRGRPCDRPVSGWRRGSRRDRLAYTQAGPRTSRGVPVYRPRRCFSPSVVTRGFSEFVVCPWVTVAQSALSGQNLKSCIGTPVSPHKGPSVWGQLSHLHTEIAQGKRKGGDSLSLSSPG